MAECMPYSVYIICQKKSCLVAITVLGLAYLRSFPINTQQNLRGKRKQPAQPPWSVTATTLNTAASSLPQRGALLIRPWWASRSQSAQAAQDYPPAANPTGTWYLKVNSLPVYLLIFLAPPAQ